MKVFIKTCIGLILATALYAQPKTSFFYKYEHPSDSIQQVALMNAKTWIQKCAERNVIEKVKGFSKLKVGYSSEALDILHDLDKHADSLTVDTIRARIKELEVGMHISYSMSAKCIIKNSQLKRCYIYFSFNINGEIISDVGLGCNDPSKNYPPGSDGGRTFFDSNCNLYHEL